MAGTRDELGIVAHHPADPSRLRLGNLFLEERVEDDGRGAGVLEPPHTVEVRAERRSACHERVAQT